MNIDDKSLVLGLGIVIVLPFICTFIEITVRRFIEKHRDSIADRKLGLIKKIIKLCEKYMNNKDGFMVTSFADKLIKLIEQEKREQAREILNDLKEYVAYETKPFIKWGSDNPKDEIPDACIDSDMLDNKIDEIAEKYGVEL